MPIRRVKGGWKWGGKGHVYPTREGAEKQAAAAHANGFMGKAKGGVVDEKEKKKSKTPVKKSNSKEPKGK
jgi:hypothetical protein